MSSEFHAIHALLRDYFDALYDCDADKLGRIFHPRAIYVSADETPLLYRDVEDYLQVVASRQSPASRSEVRRDYIDRIELAGENTGMARVRCSIGQRDFVDLLTLVRTEGQWRIMAKAFQIIERNQEKL